MGVADIITKQEAAVVLPRQEISENWFATVKQLQYDIFITFIQSEPPLVI